MGTGKVELSTSRAFSLPSLSSSSKMDSLDPIQISPSLQTTPLDVSESLVPSREHKTAGVSSVSFDGLLDDPLLLKEDLKGGCGGQMWTAGMVLARYLLHHHRSSLSGKRMYVYDKKKGKGQELIFSTLKSGIGCRNRPRWSRNGTCLPQCQRLHHRPAAHDASNADQHLPK